MVGAAAAAAAASSINESRDFTFAEEDEKYRRTKADRNELAGFPFFVPFLPTSLLYTQSPQPSGI